MKILLILAATMTAFALFCADAAAMGFTDGSAPASPIRQITPYDSAISFQQVTFSFDIGKSTNTDWGRIQAYPSRLKTAGDACTGYLNVFLHPDPSSAASQWAVENLCIPDVDGNDCSNGSIDFSREPRPMGTFFDLRPGMNGTGEVDGLYAVVLFSRQPLPLMETVRALAAQFSPYPFKVRQVLVDAEGDESEEEELKTQPQAGASTDTVLQFGPPPQPSPLSPIPPLDLAFPVEVFQTPAPNVNAAKNQCVPMAYANALQYLMDRYNGFPLQWKLQDIHSPGWGQQLTAGDLLLNIWVPNPVDSLVAQIDARAKRLFSTDFDSGKGTSRCKQIRAIFGYLAARGGLARAVFRHQGGKELYGEGDGECDDGSIDLGGLVSTQEGDNPTWGWIFDQLKQGRAVVMGYQRYDLYGNRVGGHMLRVWGAAHYNDKDYLFTLDDAKQGTGEFGTDTDGTQTLQWEVADHNQPGMAGVPNGRLEMEGENVSAVTREITWAVSIEAQPTLSVP